VITNIMNVKVECQDPFKLYDVSRFRFVLFSRNDYKVRGLKSELVKWKSTRRS